MAKGDSLSEDVLTEILETGVGAITDIFGFDNPLDSGVSPKDSNTPIDIEYYFICPFENEECIKCGECEDEFED